MAHLFYKSGVQAARLRIVKILIKHPKKMGAWGKNKINLGLL